MWKVWKIVWKTYNFSVEMSVEVIVEFGVEIIVESFHTPGVEYWYERALVWVSMWGVAGAFGTPLHALSAVGEFT